MKKKVLLISLMFVLFGIGQCLAAEDEPAWSAQDLLKPEVFPNAQFGMAVESAEDGPMAKIVTTGGEFIINKAKDSIECKQRIVEIYKKLPERSVAIVKFPAGSLSKLQMTNKTTGSAIFSDGKTTVRINCDSLLMVQPGKDGDIKAGLTFMPDFHYEFHGNYNFFSPEGGISFFEHGKCPESKFQAKVDPVTVTWQWKAGNVFWAGISPPKPYDWNYPLKNKVVRYGSSVDRYMYPDDMSIVRWSKLEFANILFLHCEPMWKHWQRDLTPKDEAEFKRTLNTAHEWNMKLLVYCSPYYFTKGTSIENKANPDPHYGPGWHTGSNAKIYLEQVTRLVNDYGVDGLYFDGLYPSRKSLATEYYISRACRQLLGDNGILEYHCTTDSLGADRSGGAYCPTIHAYFNFILKGEGEYNRNDPGYLRYYMSTFGISNSVGVAEFFSTAPTLVQTDTLMRANLHFHLPEHFFYTGDIDSFRKFYWPRLAHPYTFSYIRRHDLSRPTGIFDQYRNSLP